MMKWKLCEFTYLGDIVSASGSCEIALSSRTRHG